MNFNSLLNFLPFALMAASFALGAWGLLNLVSASIFQNRAARSLGEYYQTAQQENSPVQTGSFEHRVRLAALNYRIDVAKREGLAFWGAVATLSLVLLSLTLWFHLPIALSLVAPLIGWAIVNGQVNNAFHAMRIGIEKEIPTLLMRLSATVQVVSNIQEALNDIILSLEPGGPLQTWMLKMQKEMQVSGRAAFENLREEAASISPALAMVVIQIERLQETGGGGYAQAFQLVAHNLAGILETRAQAAAKADGAWGTIRIILFALGGSLLAATSSAGGQLFSGPAMQIGMFVAAGWALLGWNVIGDNIREVTE